MDTICSKPGCNNPAKVKFCSRSCAASYNNTIVPKRKPEHKCKVCSTPVPATKRYCDNCVNESPTRAGRFCVCGGTKHPRSVICSTCRDNEYAITTLGTLRKKAIRDAQVYNYLRQKSRRIAVENGLTGCLDCGWNEHVEVCHINDLSKLPDTCTVLEAIGPQNFILLCPNHHWKFDHNTNYRETLLTRLDSNQVPRG